MSLPKVAGKTGEKGAEGLGGNALSFACSLPLLVAFSESSSARVAESFGAAGMEWVDAKRYLSGTFLLSMLSGAACLVACLSFAEAALSLAICLVASACLMAISLLIPSLLARRRRSLYEQELPFVLRELAACIDVGLPFEKAICRIGSGDYAVSGLFSECSSQIASGASVQQALSSLSSRTGLLPMKRAMLVLSSIYETGGSAEPLKRMSEELSGSMLIAMRGQSGRFSLLAIAFVASSSLLPSFFMVYASVAPSLSGEGIDANSFYAAFLLAFPAMDAAVLAAIFLSLPPQGKSRVDDFALASDYAARKCNIGDLKAFLAALFAASAAASAAALYSGLLPFAALLLCLAPAAYALLSYFASREISESVMHLPDALYSAAATHKLFSSERMLSFLSGAKFGRLSEAFAIALARQKAGENFEQSLMAASLHCPSPLVHRAFSLLVVAHQTGADMYFAMRECASDAVSFFALVQERAALLSMQLYTVLAASAFLVPVIIGAVAYVSPVLLENSLALSEGGESTGGAMLPSAEGIAMACQLYLVINAALCSLLLALVEGSRGKAVLYFLACAPLSQAVFAAVSSGALFTLAA